MADHATLPAVTYWLSFCDAKRPKGQQFLGVVLVDVDTLPDAITATWLAKVNPGGEIQTMAIPADVLVTAPPDVLQAFQGTPRLTLLSYADLVRYGHDVAQEGDGDA